MSLCDMVYCKYTVYMYVQYELYLNKIILLYISLQKEQVFPGNLKYFTLHTSDHRLKGSLVAYQKMDQVYFHRMFRFCC